ncbi:nitroreductase family protein [Desulfogranum mediterraneum]|uniref:nitroreductase family protein n=1 Tax=Desulfogranum mediterraneum TaxID=160661 RepID=UPI0004032C08|nr:nitroreductase family protein [Desulfogranum mediterraneum]
MNAIEMIKERRSVRKFKNEKVDRATMKEIIDISRWAPSWANYQVARYTLVDDAAVMQKLANDGVKGFVYNMSTLKNAKGVLVLSFVKGKSGKLDLEKEEYATSKANVWEVFDAGIACQTFCLAAHAKGVGTCIFGVIDDDSISEIVNLPEDETVAALIVYGYEEGEHVKPTSRKDVGEIMRFVDA